MSRIKLTDTPLDIMVKLAEGNPGAISALSALCIASPKIDPDSAFSILAPAISFDTHGIYGTEIYIIWNDKCGRDVRKTLMLLRAVQLGFLPESKLKEMASDQSRQVDLTAEKWAELDSKVCERLEGFKKTC